MRFLGVSETCDLGALYLSLQDEGHEVRVAISEPEARGTLAGLVGITDNWRAELDWVRAAGDHGIILFESVSEGFGRLQDGLRAQGFNVIGGSAYGDRLENDRAYAYGVLAELGFANSHVWTFSSPADAAAFIAGRPARYVLKYSETAHDLSETYVGLHADGRDVLAILRAQIAERRPGSRLLMAFIEGIEMGVGAYFNGERFLTPACLDWEHKRFFPGDLGELTGEMGTVVTYDRSDRFFERTLARMQERLRQEGYVGYINLNTIVNSQGIWPLEFSCRFGYPGFAVLAPLQVTPWGALFQAMISRSVTTLRTLPGFSVGVVLTTPPFPYSRKQVCEPVGMPVLFQPNADRRHFHYGEVGLDAAGQLCTSGLYGWTMVVTGLGGTISEANRAAYENVRDVVIPNVRYRLDIGDRLIGGDYSKLEALDLLDPLVSADTFEAGEIT